MGNIYLLIYYLIYLVAVFTAGSLFLKLFNIKFENKVEKKAYEFAVGNLLYSYVFIYLGIFHLLYGQLLLILYILPSIWFVKNLFFGNFKIDLSLRIKKFLRYKWETPEVFIFLFLILTFLPLVPLIFSFPASWDALAYHLLLPKIYLRDHFFSFYSWFAQTSMPIGIESLFGYGEVVGESRLGNFIVFTFLGAIVVYMLYGLRYLFSRKVLFLAFILFLFKPIIFSSVSVNPFVDFPFAFYGLIFLITLKKYFDNQKWQVLVLILILGLFTFMIKYVLGLVFLFALFVVLVIHTISNYKSFKNLFYKLKSFRKLLPWFMLTIFLVPILYWLFRNFVYFRNPIHPFLNDFFKGFDYDAVNYKAQMMEVKRGSLDLDILINYLLRLPGDYSILEESLFSTILIVFPILGILHKEKVIKYGSLFGLLFSFIVYWWVGFPSYRYILAVAPILAIISSFLFFDLFKKLTSWYKIPLIAIFIISLSVQLLSTYHFEINFFFDNFKTSLKSMISYKEAIENLYLQDNYQSINYVNKNLDKSRDKILVVFDNRLYYFDIPAIYANQSIGGVFTNTKMKSIGEVLEEIKRLKITYVFVNTNWGIYPNLRKDLYYPFVENYLEPISSASGTIVYRVKQNK